MSPLDAASIALRFGRFIVHPNLDALIEFFDSVNRLPSVTQPVLRALRNDPASWRSFAARPRVGAMDLDALAKLPGGTLGHEFARHLRANHLDPNALPTRSASTDEEYVWAHRYETHDIWHVLFDFGSDVAGELGVQAVYAAQLPMRSLLALMGMSLVRTTLVELDEYETRTNAIVRGWLLGRRARSVFGVDWKAHWGEPLAEVRRRHHIDVEGVDRLLAQWSR